MMSAWRKTRQDPTSLRLFTAGTPLGPWVEHPASPIVDRDDKISRPGGRPISHDGQFYRFAQDCSQTYGEHVFAIRIDALTSMTYAECPPPPSPLLSAGNAGWNAGGMHHVDAREISPGRWLVAVDGWFS